MVARPRDGEIDFPEGNLDRTIEAFVHRQDATSGGDQAAFATSAHFTDWHTAVIEWSPGRVALFLDDEPVGSTTERVPDTPMHWVIQTETALDCAPTDQAQGHVLIDWVVAYART